MKMETKSSALNHHHHQSPTTTKYLINKIQFFFCFQVLLLLLLSPLVRSSKFAASSSSSSSNAGSNSNSRVVRYLPGLELPGGGSGGGGDGGGPLPFHLETGYVGIGESMDIQLFYYFFKSERNPKEDPLVLWLTGGPRCSVLSGLTFQLLGPVKFVVADDYNDSLPNLVLNPYSWTKIANIIFLDAPVGTGFSYSKSSPTGPTIGDIESAEQTYEFLRKWLVEEHPDFQSNPLYIAGDSYSGMIIPIIVQELINDIEAGKYPFLNFKGYALGNPVTDIQLQDNAAVIFAHGLGLISYELYESMKENCKGNNYVNIDLTNVNCSKDHEVYKKCVSGINVLQVLEPLCPYVGSPEQMRRSLAKTREVFSAESLLSSSRCRSNSYLLAQYWANDDRVRNALHIRKGTVKNWIRCNYGLPYVREIQSSIEYHRNLSMKQGGRYRSLIYSGDHDMWVSHISTEAWIRSLDLSIVDDWRPWLVGGQIAGYTRTYSSGMTYVTVKGAGHTATEYKPVEGVAMFERWTSQTPL